MTLHIHNFHYVTILNIHHWSSIIAHPSLLILFAISESISCLKLPPESMLGLNVPELGLFCDEVRVRMA